MTTVTWVKDANDYYEVSSPEHLIQLMHSGSKYVNEGDSPTSYTNNTTKFLQTVDIDLANFHEHIKPIPGSPHYDGGNHAISNWEYHGDGNTGFFLWFGGQFKNSKLTGVWKLGGNTASGWIFHGFVAGYFGYGGLIENVTTDFEFGTEIYGTTTVYGVGCLVGKAESGTTIYGCTVSGTILLTDNCAKAGGLVAEGINVNIILCANYATFPNGIKSRDNGNCGGIIGTLGGATTNFHSIVNGMKGDIGNESQNSAGGIIGLYSPNTPPTRFDTFVVAMIGNITCKNSGTSGAGGIIGETSGSQDLVITKAVNYMSGDISGSKTGGIIGVCTNTASTAFSITNSIVALNGDVQHDTVVNQYNSTTADLRVTVNSDFGLTFATNNYASTDALVDFVTHDVFALLPYIPISGTSDEGFDVSIDPIFGNLGGLDPASPYASYQTLTLHTSPEIYYPAYVNMGFSDTNTTRYLTYGRVSSHKITVHVDDAITGPFAVKGVDSVFNNGGTLLKGVEWIQNGSGEYEVSTSEHLVQIMSNGAAYDDMGTPPSYMSSNFVQTSDIDLSFYAIQPIGSAETPFTGGYSGSMHSISNWKYDRGSPDDGTGVEIGLFGRVEGGSISGVKMTGVWSAAGSCDVHGLLVGTLVGTSVLSNIEADFESGTSVSSGNATSSTCGLLIGAVQGDSAVTGLHVQGHVSYSGTDTVLGGVIGKLSETASLSWVTNNLTCSLSGSDVAGGVIGTIGDGAPSAFNLSNNSSGDLSGAKCGGVVGSCATGAMTRADTWANAMTGDIIGSACAGGVIGEFEVSGIDVTAVTKVTNYMSGDITSTASGGVIGKTVDSSAGTAPAIQCTNSVVAMHGTVGDTAVGDAGHAVSVAINVNSDFGMAFTTNSHATTDALTGFETFSDFPLPFLSMTGTESGFTHDRQVIFPNVKGVAEASPLFGYEVVVIHSSSTIHVPFRMTFDFAPDGTKYIGYAKVATSELYVDSSLTVISSSATHVMDYDGFAKPGFFLPSISATTVQEKDNTTTVNQRYNIQCKMYNFTSYEDNSTEEVLCFNKDSSYLGPTNVLNLTMSNKNRWVRSLGMVYNPHDKSVYYVTNESGPYTWNNYRKVRKVTLGGGGTDLHDEMIRYNTIVSDSSKTYMFGSRKATDYKNEVYRMDMDGTNMITVRVEDILGSNREVYGFTSNPDDERIYFSDHPDGTVYSLSWSLDDIQTMPFVVRGASHSSIFYHQGHIYFGNKNPITGEDDTNIYAYDMVKGGCRTLEGFSLNLGGTAGQIYLHVHPTSKALLVCHSGGTKVLVGDNFDFHKDVITLGDTKYTDGYEFSWVPVDGATSYRLDMNGVTTTTTETSYTTRGHADGTVLNLKLSYSTDDTTYTAVEYGNYVAVVSAQIIQKYTPNAHVTTTAAVTWADPYENPEIALILNGSSMYTYNVVSRTFTTSPSRGMTRLDRSPTTKDIIAQQGANLYNAGQNAINLTNDTLPPAFYTHSTTIKYIHCSYSGLIYFIDQSSGVWTVGLDGTGATLLFTKNNCKIVSTDSYSPDKLVYNDGGKIMYLNLTTNVATQVISEWANFQGICVLDGVVYYTIGNSKYSRVSLDGTMVYTEDISYNAQNLLVDPSQQKVIVFSGNDVYEFVDGNFTIPSLPDNPSSMVVAVSPLGVRATWSPISDATSYRIGISLGSDGDNPITVHYTTSDTSALDYTHTLGSESTHTVYLMYDTLTETDLLSSSRTITIPAQSTNAEDYSKEFFRGKSGKFDLTKVRNVDLGPVMNSLFESGDDVQIKLRRGKRFPKAKFVNRGDTVQVQEVEAVLLPFDQSAGTSQTISLQLSDGSTSSVLYNETDDTITIDSGVYSAGDYTIIDNQKVSVHSY